LKPNLRFADKVEIPLSEGVEFATRYLGKGKLIAADLKANCERMKKDTFTADIIINLTVNYEAGAGKKGLALTKFLVDHGVDAAIENQSGGEQWVVVFNSDVVVRARKVPAAEVTKEMRELPKVSALDSPKDPLPPEPGTLPIPPMTVRLYHYTKSYDNLASIKAQGLLGSMGRGDGGTGAGEPSAGIWASTYPPENYHLFVEFYASPDQISHRANYPEGKWGYDEAGTWRKAPITQAELDEWASREMHVIMQDNVSTSQFLAIHEPWHHHARYLLELTDVELQQAGLLDPAEVEKLEKQYHSPNEAKALAYVQKVKGVTKTAAQRGIWYHGSRFVNLRSILAQGLIPDVKKREWQDDPWEFSTTSPSASIPFLRLTRCSRTAAASPGSSTTVRPRSARTASTSSTSTTPTAFGWR
jgi:hypothetical protein